MASEDAFHIVGYTTHNILDGSQMKLTGLGHVVLKRNEELWKQVGPSASSLTCATFFLLLRSCVARRDSSGTPPSS